jgi:hypothetical protein
MQNLIILIILFVSAVSAFAQQTSSANRVCSEKSLELSFPSSNNGKFRLKTRDENIGFGKTFAARQKPFTDKVYMEWQIGYDALVEDVKSGKKQTTLTQEKFIGSSGREKYPYELSEILYDLIKCGLISAKEIDSLAAEINGYNRFFDEREIEVEKPTNLLLNKVTFKETSIKLPTLLMPQTSDGTIIEVSIQKQQYASGVQPMIYFCIPFKSFANWKDLDGKKSVKGNTLKYVVKKENAEVILNMFRVFGMVSSRHKFDVEQILKIIRTRSSSDLASGKQ